MTARRLTCAGAAAVALLLAGCAADPVALPAPTTSTVAAPPTTALDPVVEAERRTAALEAAARGITVRVRNRTCATVGTGSGTVIDARTLVTNRHVVEGALELGLETWDGRTLAAAVASATLVADLAIVELAEPFPLTAVVDDRRLEAGDGVQVVGYPGGDALTFTTGSVVDYVVDRGFDTTEAVLRVTAEVRPGNSGGPVLDADGRLVAVVFAIETATGNGLAVPVDVLTDVLAADAFDEPVRSCLDG